MLLAHGTAKRRPLHPHTLPKPLLTPTTPNPHIPNAAGVADIERGQAALAFAKRYELLAPDALANIKLVEVDYSDPDSLAVRGRVVVVDGDTYVGGKAPDVSGEAVEGVGVGANSDPDSLAVRGQGCGGAWRHICGRQGP